MAIPEFDDYGLLPDGTHVASTAEIEERYCKNPNRHAIWTKFLAFYAQELSPKRWTTTVLVDGGFTSNKPHTKDIDVILDLSARDDSTVWEAVGWTTVNYNRIKLSYDTDLWIYHPSVGNDLRAFFRYIKEEERIDRGAPVGHRKGLLRLEL